LSRVSLVQYSPRRQSRWVLADYGGKDLWNNKPTTSVSQAGCPSCHPTISVKALKEKNITFRGLLSPTSPGVL